MANSDWIRFDQAALDNHADDYCRRELYLSHELEDTLRNAALYAPMQYTSRTRRCMSETERVSRYFSKMNDTLVELGQLVNATSRAVLEHLETADEIMKALLK